MTAPLTRFIIDIVLFTTLAVWLVDGFWQAFGVGLLIHGYGTFVACLYRWEESVQNRK